MVAVVVAAAVAVAAVVVAEAVAVDDVQWSFVPQVCAEVTAVEYRSKSKTITTLTMDALLRCITSV